MVFAISPIHNTESFSPPLTLDNKIEIFIARVKCWQTISDVEFRS